MSKIYPPHLQDERFIAFTVGAPADHMAGSEIGEYNRLLLKVELSPVKLTWLTLEHSDKVILNPHARTHADAVIVTEPGLAVGFTTADCLPIVIAAKRKQNESKHALPETLGIAGIHAGWLGLSSGVIERSVERMSEEQGFLSQEMFAWIGPAIKREDYEVGLDTYQALSRIPAAHDEHFTVTRPGHWLADLPALAAAVLMDKGIPKDQISLYPHSSFAHPQLHSFRRDKEMSGRMATVVGLKLCQADFRAALT